MALPSRRSLRGTDLVIARDEEGGANSAPESTFKIRLANQPRIRNEASILINERYAQHGYGPQKIADERDRLTIVAYEGRTPVGTLRPVSTVQRACCATNCTSPRSTACAARAGKSASSSSSLPTIPRHRRSTRWRYCFMLPFSIYLYGFGPHEASGILQRLAELGRKKS